MNHREIMQEIGAEHGVLWTKTEATSLLNLFLEENNLEEAWREYCEQTAKEKAGTRHFRVEIKYDSLMDVLHIAAPARYVQDEEWWPAIAITEALQAKLKAAMDGALGEGCYDYFYDGPPDFDYEIDDSTGAYCFYSLCTLQFDEIEYWRRAHSEENDES